MTRSRVNEMEFLDIYSIKDSSLLLHAIHSPTTSGFTENHSLVLKIHTKKSAKQENLSLFMHCIR
jgi:hypothetical protein